MTDTHPQRSVLWPALRRFWPVALVTAAVAGLSSAVLVEATSQPSVVASSSYVVPVAPPVTPLQPGEAPEAPSPLPNSPGAAADYAEVYAVLLVEDGAILQALADATGVPVEDVPEQMQALAVNGGSVVKVSATGDTRAEAEAYLDTLDALFASPAGATVNIPAGNLVPLNRGPVVESTGLAPLAPVVGVIVGLLLGIGAAVVLERGDSRFRNGEDVRALVDWPALALSHDPEDPRAEVLTERVRRAGADLRTVALVAPRGSRPADLEDLAWVLSEADRDHVTGGVPVRWTVAGVLRGDGDAEQRAQDADALVLVVPAGARMRNVTSAVRAVEDLAVTPVVVALPERLRRHRGGPSGGPTVGSGEVGGPVGDGYAADPAQAGPTYPLAGGPVDYPAEPGPADGRTTRDSLTGR